MYIDETKEFYGKKIKNFIEKWNEDKRCVELSIVFEDDTILNIVPYINKDAKFDINKNDLRLGYSKSI